MFLKVDIFLCNSQKSNDFSFINWSSICAYKKDPNYIWQNVIIWQLVFYDIWHIMLNDIPSVQHGIKWTEACYYNIKIHSIIDILWQMIYHHTWHYMTNEKLWQMKYVMITINYHINFGCLAILNKYCTQARDCFSSKNLLFNVGTVFCNKNIFDINKILK